METFFSLETRPIFPIGMRLAGDAYAADQEGIPEEANEGPSSAQPKKAPRGILKKAKEKTPNEDGTPSGEKALACVVFRVEGSDIVHADASTCYAITRG